MKRIQKMTEPELAVLAAKVKERQNNQWKSRHEQEIDRYEEEIARLKLEIAQLKIENAALKNAA